MAAVFRPAANLAATLALLSVASLVVIGVAWWWLWPRTNYARRTYWTTIVELLSIYNRLRGLDASIRGQSLAHLDRRFLEEPTETPW